MIKKIFYRIVALGILASCNINAAPLMIETTKVEKGELTKQSIFIATLQFKYSSKIASQHQGLVDKVYINIGDKVKAGQKLASLNADSIKFEMEAKEAKLAQANFQAQKIQNELARYKNLLDSQSIAPQQYENLEFELKGQQANIKALQADIKYSKDQINKMTILAPFDGIVLDRLINPGEWLKTGDGVALVVNSSEVEVLAYVPSDIARFLKIKDKVNVEVNDKNYKGTITALIPRADIRSRSFPVYIKIPKSNEFFDGMAANVRLNVAGKVSGFIVPRDSIVHYLGNNVVFVIKDSKAMSVNVKILSMQENLAVIKASLDENDIVAIKGQDKLFDGAPIKEINNKGINKESKDDKNTKNAKAKK